MHAFVIGGKVDGIEPRYNISVLHNIRHVAYYVGCGFVCVGALHIFSHHLEPLGESRFVKFKINCQIH
uniref:DNA n=1 Tax=Autographa californica nuclear polyhedrosis virus TaxID=46015 RepID=Q64811_NPVAC|nr:unnamed protein product [Autographa californica nucleopolyhedrovirus]